jgi:hypothetical protein
MSITIKALYCEKAKTIQFTIPFTDTKNKFYGFTRSSIFDTMKDDDGYKLYDDESFVFEKDYSDLWYILQRDSKGIYFMNIYDTDEKGNNVKYSTETWDNNIELKILP